MSENKKILIVEDEIDLVELYRFILEEVGYQVETAKDGTEGEKKMKTGNWDLVLLDLMLPTKGGVEILNSLTEEEKADCGKIVALTNLDESALKKCGFDVETHEYLLKAKLNPDQLTAKVQSFLEE